MDSLTQIVLGAAVGEAVLGKKIGNKAPLWGGIIATVPDLDVIPAIWMDAVGKISFHRGFSHSLFFFILASPLFGWLLCKLYRRQEATWHDWTILSFLALFTHSLLDCFTSWGTQLFWPHPYRVAWNTIFVVDPLYTIPFLVAVIWMTFYNKLSAMRQKINYAGLVVSSTYLVLTVVNKQIVNGTFEDALASKQIKFERYTTKPAPFNNILWTAVIELDEGYYTGYYSFLDRDEDISFSYVDKKHELLGGLPPDDNLSTLIYITNGYYSVEKLDDRLLLHDLRFGLALDTKTGKRDFISSFFVRHDQNGDGKKLEITQKPRSFKDITGDMFVTLWRRMTGDKEIRI